MPKVVAFIYGFMVHTLLQANKFLKMLLVKDFTHRIMLNFSKDTMIKIYGTFFIIHIKERVGTKPTLTTNFPDFFLCMYVSMKRFRKAANKSEALKMIY
jgi:hypothetical protein